MSQTATLISYIILTLGMIPVFALLSIGRVAVLQQQEDRIEKLVSAGTSKSEAVLKTIRKTRSELATAHMGILLILAAHGWAVSRLWALINASWAHAVPPALLGVTSLLVLIVTTSIYVVLGLIIPSNYASAGLSSNVSQISVGLVAVLRFPLYPFVKLVEGAARILLKISKRWAPDDLEGMYSRDELPYTAIKSYRYGLLGAAQRELLGQVFEFKEATARDIATPVHEMACLLGQTRLSKALDIVRHLGFTRYPVVDGTKDRVIGIVHYRDLVDGYDANPRSFVTDVMDNALILPSDMPVTRVLQALQEHRTPMAVIQNDHEGVEGLVTIEDIMQHFFEPQSASANEHEPPLIRVLSRDVYEFDGRLIVHEVEEALGIRLSHAGLETIGNHIFSLLGRKSREGDHVKINGVRFDVIQMQGARITRVRAQKTREIPPDLDLPARRTQSS